MLRGRKMSPISVMLASDVYERLKTNGKAMKITLLRVPAINKEIYQIQHERTRMNNVLDLVFVTNINLVNNVKVYPGMSDHNCIITDINLKVKHCRKPPRTVYRFSKGNMDAVMHDLGTEFERFVRADPSSRTVDDNWNDFKTTLMSSLNKHIPRKH